MGGSARATTRMHTMPFGAQVLGDGSVRFRLWAPAARSVALSLEDTTRRGDHPHGYGLTTMTSEPEGWFSVTTSGATIGSRYRFQIDQADAVPDPASRYQSDDVHGASEVIAPCAWEWHDTDWRGRPWEDAVVYELHIGTFTRAGTFRGAIDRLDYLAELGITAIEVMPVADFPGQRNWGYDGVCLFAPDSRYGRPDDFKALIEAAHERGLMVILDVVYNHFGPEGNYLHLYAPQFFTDRHKTPWGAAINYDGEHCYWVRQFFIHNALYWLEEFHLDGLRLDAVHAIVDDSRPDILTELAQRVHERFDHERHIHLILENDHNAAHYLARDRARPRWYTAQWNDDIHHALHVLLTDQAPGYYADYADDPLRHLGRCLCDGFAYQGEHSAYRDAARGEPSGHLPPQAFMPFLQNHDQIGNRAFGERLTSLAHADAQRAAIAIVLLLPSPPLLFMGEEWGCTQPFLFFCDFGAELAAAVTDGRRREFAQFPEFSAPSARQRIPDPMDPATFARCVLDWEHRHEAIHIRWLTLYRELLALRRAELMPRLQCMVNGPKSWTRLGERALSASWELGDASRWILMTNLGDRPLTTDAFPRRPPLYASHAEMARVGVRTLPPWSTAWYLIREDPPR